MENVNENIDMESNFFQEHDNVRKSVGNIPIELAGNEKEITQHVPNAVQTLNDIVEVEKSEKLELQIPEHTATVSELHGPVIDKTKTLENTPTNSEHLEPGGVNGKIDVTKIETSSFPRRKGSLSVPAFSTLLKDERRESTVSNVRKGSKLSMLSPISRQSVQLKADFTSVPMPVDEKSSVLQQEDSWIRVAIPYLPLWVAVLCLVLNILIAGSGTILSGLCILCCAKSRVPPKYDPDPILLLCVNTWVGIAQLFTVTFLLVGWFWSVAWGIRMVVLSLEHRRELRELRATQLKEQALNAFGKALAARKM